MNTQQPTRRNGAASTALMIFGGTIMLIALIWFIALYNWAHQPYQGGEQWGDLIATMYMICGALPAFVFGLILLLVGWSAKGKSRAAQRDLDTAKPSITQ